MAHNIERREREGASNEVLKKLGRSEDEGEGERVRRDRSRYIASLFGRGSKERMRIGEVFKDEKSALNVSLEGLTAKKRVLEKGRESLTKKHQDFSASQKQMNHLLKPFEGERREFLLQALDCKLNPIQRDGEKSLPLTPEAERRFDEVIGELDARSEPERQEATHLAVYMHLLTEQVHAAEDKLNDASSRDVERRIGAINAKQNLIGAIESQPTALGQISHIVGQADMPERKKIHAIDEVLTGGREPLAREAVPPQTARELVSAIASAKLTIRTNAEKLSKLRELSQEEQLLAQIPESTSEWQGRREMEEIEKYE